MNPEKQRIFADITLVHFAAQGAEEPENGKQSESYVGQQTDCLVHETDAGGYRTKRLSAGFACIFL